MNAPSTTLVEVDVDQLEANLGAYRDELLRGSGAVVIRQGFTPAEIAEARSVIMHHSSVQDDKVTHFVGGAGDKASLQRRVWNLLAKGEIFERMAQHPAVVAIVGSLLGSEFIMGSIAANRLLPGGPGQEPHIDYPYWDLYKDDTFPAAINSSFALNAQATILLDDFTEQNGATAFWPTSQQDLRYPDDNEGFAANAIRQLGQAGDIVIFNGMCWHCAMPNNSDDDRTGLLIEYLPKFVTPLEDLQATTPPEVIERATPMMRQLLSLAYPYPQNLDEAAAVNAEGKN